MNFTTLNLPQQRDPLARIVLFLLIGLALYANVVSISTPVSAQSGGPGEIILMATPTPALPTPALAELPAITLDEPVTYPAVDGAPVALPAPVWPDAPPAQPVAPASDDYLANVGAQAEHSPRGDTVPPAPAHESGPILYTDEQGEYIVEPAAPTHAPALPAIAVAVPPITAEQAAILAARDSHGCAAGEVFYPRTGCHFPGSGGPMPGAVGED